MLFLSVFIPLFQDGQSVSFPHAKESMKFKRDVTGKKISEANIGNN